MFGQNRNDPSKSSSAGASHSHTFNPRSLPAHGVYRQINRPTLVFLTVCTSERKPYLADPVVHQHLVDVWTQADKWLVGRYVIMPDHIHLFASPASRDITFDAWVKFWKSQFTRRVS